MLKSSSKFKVGSYYLWSIFEELYFCYKIKNDFAWLFPVNIKAKRNWNLFYTDHTDIDLFRKII